MLYSVLMDTPSGPCADARGSRLVAREPLGAPVFLMEKDMSIPRDEFLRSLAAACADDRFDVYEDHVEIKTRHGFGIRVRLRCLPPRRIGALRLPRLRVEYLFRGAAPQQARAWFCAVAPYFQRGGG